MEKIDTEKTRNIHTVYTVLRYIAFALAAVIVIGTVIGLIRGRDTMPPAKGGSGAEQSAGDLTQGEDIRVFSGIGRLRIPLVNSSVLTLSIAFPYQASDIAFTEELAGKINQFKTIAIDYFTALPEDQIIQINEETAKSEILSRFNSILRLGRISALYFNDMMVLDAN
jgi:flagellar basal body-associated protein FliL